MVGATVSGCESPGGGWDLSTFLFWLCLRIHAPWAERILASFWRKRVHFSLLALVSLSSIFSLLGKKIIYIYTIYTTSLPIACFSAHCYMYRHASDLLHLLPLSLLPLGASQHCCRACPELSRESKVAPGGCPLACACPQEALVKSTMRGG